MGMTDEKWGQVCVAFIVPNGEPPSVKELDTHCIEDPNLARYKRPRYYQMVDSLPYTPTGKKIRYKMSGLIIKEELIDVFSSKISSQGADNARA